MDVVIIIRIGDAWEPIYNYKKKKNVRGQNAFKGRTKLREVRRAYEQVWIK